MINVHKHLIFSTLRGMRNPHDEIRIFNPTILRLCSGCRDSERAYAFFAFSFLTISTT